MVRLSSWQWRLVSALILIPIVLLIIWAGRSAFGALLGVVVGLALSELWQMVRSEPRRVLYMSLGGFYIALSFLLCYQLRELFGMLPTVLFFAALWGSDIGAYLCGKSIGGPKMAGDISPNKTWAGYVGALSFPALIIMVVSFEFDWQHLSAGLALGVAGQAGDLMMSWLKRMTGVKDTGSLIPGHGGVLDRLDSLMLAIPVYLALLKAGFIL